MDQLMAMRAFTRVVESGSFTRAADSLNMPIATLSKLVKSLEAHLETRLLHRTTRRVVTTAEGMEYYEKALRVLIDIEDIDTAFRASCCTPFPPLPDAHSRFGSSIGVNRWRSAFRTILESMKATHTWPRRWRV